MLEDDLDDALEKLRSDSCRRAAAVCPTMVDAATSTMKRCVMRDASCTAAVFVPATSGPAAQLVLKVGNMCGKDISCQATPSVRNACVGTHVRM
eukprot:2787379-Prymnesium_polylepis.1